MAPVAARFLSAQIGRVADEHTPAAWAAFLTNHGWRNLGGQWASLEWDNPCLTFRVMQAARIYILLALCKKLNISVPDWKIILEVTR